MRNRELNLAVEPQLNSVPEKNGDGALCRGGISDEILRGIFRKFFRVGLCPHPIFPYSGDTEIQKLNCLTIDLKSRENKLNFCHLDHGNRTVLEERMIKLSKFALFKKCLKDNLFFIQQNFKLLPIIYRL